MDILLKPVVTEKAMREAAAGRYTFVVRKEANKAQIARATKEAFKVGVIRVQTMMMPGKSRRAGKARKVVRDENFKKAVVTIPAGQKIELFDVTEGQRA